LKSKTQAAAVHNGDTDETDISIASDSVTPVLQNVKAGQQVHESSKEQQLDNVETVSVASGLALKLGEDGLSTSYVSFFPICTI
jgi:hypothetical protein